MKIVKFLYADDIGLRWCSFCGKNCEVVIQVLNATICADCVNELKKKFAKERETRRLKECYMLNREEIIKYQKEYRAKNRDKIRKRARETYQRDKDLFAEKKREASKRYYDKKKTEESFREKKREAAKRYHKKKAQQS